MSARPAPPPADEPAQRLNRSEWAYLACEPLVGSMVQPYLFRFNAPVSEAEARAAVRDLLSAFPRLRAVLEPTRRRFQWQVLPDDARLDQMFDQAFRVDHIDLDKPEAVLRWHELAANEPMNMHHGLGVSAQYAPHPTRPGLIFGVHHLLVDGRSMIHFVESLMKRLNGQPIEPQALVDNSMLPAVLPPHWWQWPGKLYKAWQHIRSEAREHALHDIVQLPGTHGLRHTACAVQHHQLGCSAKELSRLGKAWGGSSNSVLTAAVGTAMLRRRGTSPRAAALMRMGVDLRRYHPADARPLLGNQVSVFDVLLPAHVPEAERVAWVDARVRAGLARYQQREVLLPLLPYEMLGWLRPHDYQRLLLGAQRQGRLPALSCHLTNIGGVDAFNAPEAQVRLSELYPIVSGLVPLLVLVVINGQQTMVSSHPRGTYLDADVRQLIDDTREVLQQWLAQGLGTLA
jgi:hypothetical protein